MTNHFISIGANLPCAVGGARFNTPLQICTLAVRALAQIPGACGITRSGWYSSAALPPSGQPRYVNAVVRLQGTFDPAALLAQSLAIEQEFGRVRSVPNAARTLDLDVIAMGDLVRTAPDPVLPHPRAHLRGFVLRPLRDVAPDWVHPQTGQTIHALIAALPPQDIYRL